MENSSKKLYDIIENLLKEKVVLAFSGGVDSALLLKIATSLRKDENDVVAMFFKAPSSTEEDLVNAKNLAEEMGVKLFIKDVDIFVACIGTGGTFSGVAKRLKEYNPAILCMAGEPEKSAVLSGRQAGSHKIQGIGANFVPANFDRELADDILLISDREAVFETVRFAKETGILVGISSGANIALAKRLSLRYPGKKIVTVAPDGGEKYLSVLDFD